MVPLCTCIYAFEWALIRVDDSDVAMVLLLLYMFGMPTFIQNLFINLIMIYNMDSM